MGLIFCHFLLLHFLISTSQRKKLSCILVFEAKSNVFNVFLISLICKAKKLYQVFFKALLWTFWMTCTSTPYYEPWLLSSFIIVLSVGKTILLHALLSFAMYISMTGFLDLFVMILEHEFLCLWVAVFAIVYISC